MAERQSRATETTGRMDAVESRDTRVGRATGEALRVEAAQGGGQRRERIQSTNWVISDEQRLLICLSTLLCGTLPPAGAGNVRKDVSWSSGLEQVKARNAPSVKAVIEIHSVLPLGSLRTRSTATCLARTRPFSSPLPGCAGRCAKVGRFSNALAAAKYTVRSAMTDREGFVLDRDADVPELVVGRRRDDEREERPAGEREGHIELGNMDDSGRVQAVW